MPRQREPRHSLLVVGAGSIGERHIRCFLATGRARVSFVEVRDELRATIAERYRDARAFGSLDAAMERDPIDAAVIATPAPLHVPQAARLVERGVHVLIEKPLSVTTDGSMPLSGPPAPTMTSRRWRTCFVRTPCWPTCNGQLLRDVSVHRSS